MGLAGDTERCETPWSASQLRLFFKHKLRKKINREHPSRRVEPGTPNCFERDAPARCQGGRLVKRYLRRVAPRPLLQACAGCGDEALAGCVPPRMRKGRAEEKAAE